MTASYRDSHDVVGEPAPPEHDDSGPTAADRLQAWLDSDAEAPSRADVRSVLWDRAEHAAEKARLRATIKRLRAQLAAAEQPQGFVVAPVLAEQEQHAVAAWLAAYGGRSGATAASRGAAGTTTQSNASATATGPHTPAASHWGTDPAHGGLTEHRGDRADCPAPDCADAEARCERCGGDPCSTCGECPGQICRDCRCDQRERDNDTETDQ